MEGHYKANPISNEFLKARDDYITYSHIIAYANDFS